MLERSSRIMLLRVVRRTPTQPGRSSRRSLARAMAGKQCKTWLYAGTSHVSLMPKGTGWGQSAGNPASSVSALQSRDYAASSSETLRHGSRLLGIMIKSDPCSDAGCRETERQLKTFVGTYLVFRILYLVSMCIRNTLYHIRHTTLVRALRIYCGVVS